MISIYVEFKAPVGKRKYQRLIVDDDGYRIYTAFLDINQLCKVLDLTPREAYELIDKSEDGYKAPII